jgi:hypothetical protein
MSRIQHDQMHGTGFCPLRIDVWWSASDLRLKGKMMLREIFSVRQIKDEQMRRWFTSETMDLIVWMNEEGEPAAFQFCYDKGRDEHAMTWRADTGLSHEAIDDGESGGALRYKATPMLAPNGHVDVQRVSALFAGAAAAVPEVIREFVASRIEGR